jgi:hypothetical protein
MARRKTAKKRCIHIVCEHFEPGCTTAMGTQAIFEIGSREFRRLPLPDLAGLKISQRRIGACNKSDDHNKPAGKFPHRHFGGQS